MEKVYHDNQNGTLNVSCTYKLEEYGPIITKVSNKLCENVTVKGFRKGKAPREMALARVSQEDIYHGMIDKLISKDFNSLLDGYDVNLVANIQPSLSVDYNQKNKTYNLLYTFYLLPTCTVKADKGLKIKEEVKEVTEEEITKKLDQLLVDNAELVPSKEESKEGDHVVLDFTGYIDGKEFDGGSASNYELVLGSHSFVPGFEEQVIGMKEGDKKTIELTFPKDYLASLANKQAKFAIHVKEVKKVEKPELNDEFAKTLDQYKAETLEDLKKAIALEIETQHKSQARNAKIAKIMAAIQKDAKFVYSDKYLEITTNNIRTQRLNQFKQQFGLSEEEFYRISGTSKEQLDKSCKEQATNEAMTYAIIRAVAKNNNIEVSEDDVAERFGGKEQYEKILKTAEEQRSKNSQFSIDGYLSSLREDILVNKVYDFLVKNN